MNVKELLIIVVDNFLIYESIEHYVKNKYIYAIIFHKYAKHIVQDQLFISKNITAAIIYGGLITKLFSAFEAFFAIYWSNICWFERYLSFFSALSTYCVVHNSFSSFTVS